MTLGGTARDQRSRELPGPNLRETAFEIKRKQTVAFYIQEIMCIHGQWGRQAEEKKPFSSSQCNCFAILVLVLFSLIAKVVTTNRKK